MLYINEKSTNQQINKNRQRKHYSYRTVGSTIRQSSWPRPPSINPALDQSVVLLPSRCCRLTAISACPGTPFAVNTKSPEQCRQTVFSVLLTLFIASPVVPRIWERLFFLSCVRLFKYHRSSACVGRLLATCPVRCGRDAERYTNFTCWNARRQTRLKRVRNLVNEFKIHGFIVVKVWQLSDLFTICITSLTKFHGTFV